MGMLLRVGEFWNLEKWWKLLIFFLDVVFDVDSVDDVYNKVVVNGVKVVVVFYVFEDEYGKVKFVLIWIYGDIVYILVERVGYWGLFLFGYKVDVIFDFIF